MKPEKILEIADKNGFNNFGKDSLQSRKEYSRGAYPQNIEYYDREADVYFNYSLADLATNESFLEALLKASGKEIVPTKVQMLTGEEWDLTYERIQLRLVRDLTNNNGNDFWEICSEFIDKDGK